MRIYRQCLSNLFLTNKNFFLPISTLINSKILSRNNLLPAIQRSYARYIYSFALIKKNYL